MAKENTLNVLAASLKKEVEQLSLNLGASSPNKEAIDAAMGRVVKATMEITSVATEFSRPVIQELPDSQWSRMLQRIEGVSKIVGAMYESYHNSILGEITKLSNSQRLVKSTGRNLDARIIDLNRRVQVMEKKLKALSESVGKDSADVIKDKIAKIESEMSLVNIGVADADRNAAGWQLRFTLGDREVKVDSIIDALRRVHAECTSMIDDIKLMKANDMALIRMTDSNSPMPALPRDLAVKYVNPANREIRDFLQSVLNEKSPTRRIEMCLGELGEFSKALDSALSKRTKMERLVKANPDSCESQNAARLLRPVNEAIVRLRKYFNMGVLVMKKAESALLGSILGINEELGAFLEFNKALKSEELDTIVDRWSKYGFGDDLKFAVQKMKKD